jgi:hypothetical protein
MILLTLLAQTKDKRSTTGVTRICQQDIRPHHTLSFFGTEVHVANWK